MKRGREGGGSRALGARAHPGLKKERQGYLYEDGIEATLLVAQVDGIPAGAIRRVTGRERFAALVERA